MKQILMTRRVARVLGFHHSEDNGRLLENLVFIELKRRGKRDLLPLTEV